MFTLKTNINQFKTKKDNKKYKVLLNAGGGAFGYVITNLMASIDYDVYKKIDVAAGTSIGGILTLLYSVSSDYKWINEIFENGVGKIFKKRPLGGIKGPLYDNKELKRFLCKVLQDYKLSDINKINQKDLHVIIPTLDYTLTQPRVFDNINLDPELDTLLWEIGLATAAAPTYFPAMEYIWKINNISSEELAQRPVNEQIYLLTKQAMEYQNNQRELLQNISYTQDKSVLIDGGVIQNIPVITTYTALRSELGIKPEDIDMFIIGTGQDFRADQSLTAEQVNKWSYLDWLTKFLIPYVTESNETTSVYWGALMGFNSFCYYNPLKTTGDMDDPKIINTLKKQCDEIRPEFQKELNQFLER